MDFAGWAVAVDCAEAGREEGLDGGSGGQILVRGTGVKR